MMFFRIVRNELYKLLRQKRMYIFLLLPLVLSILVVYSTKQWNKNHPDRLNTILASDLTFLTLDNMLPFIAFFYAVMVISFLFSEDYADGTLKLTIMRPVSRFTIFNAKITAFYLSVLLFFSTIFVSTFGIGYYFGSPEPVMQFANSQFKEFQGVTLPFWKGVEFLAACYFLCAIAVFVLGLILSFFGTASGKPSVAITLSVILFVGCYFYMMIMNNTPYIQYSIWTQFMFLYRSYFLEKWNMPMNTNIGSFRQAVQICLAYAAVFYPLAVITFCRKSILK